MATAEEVLRSQPVRITDIADRCGLTIESGDTDLSVTLDGEAIDVSSITLPTTVYNGQKTVTTAGTAEALAAAQELESGVLIKALAGNSNNVYVGDSDVDSSDGLILASGEEVFIEVDDLAEVYLDVDTDGEGVSYIAS